MQTLLNGVLSPAPGVQKISVAASKAYDWQGGIMDSNATASDLADNLRVLWGEVVKQVLWELGRYRILV